MIPTSIFSATATEKSLSSKPQQEHHDLDFTHIRRMTNRTGMVQHAKFASPYYLHGYCLDDNSRALMISALANKVNPNSCDDLIDTYLAFILHMQREDGLFRNFFSFDHQYLDEYGHEDAFGRTIWALGTLMRHDQRPHIQMLIKEILDKAYPHITKHNSIRAVAYTLCGLLQILRSNKYHKDLLPEIYHLADYICNEYETVASDNWNWYEDIISYDNAIIPYSLMLTKDILPEEKYVLNALESAFFLDRILFKNNDLQLIGNHGWYPRSGECSTTGQQAIEIPSLILMYQQLASINNAPQYHTKSQLVFQWFHGKNSLKTSLYDPLTKGCKDGIDKYSVNQNQGAESTISYWQAYMYSKYELY